jgi:hypothetical protein
MRDDGAEMRTTLEIDDDVLQAAKEIAASRGSTAGKVLSELARRGLTPSSRTKVRVRNGVPLLLSRTTEDSPLTVERVNDLRDDE